MRPFLRSGLMAALGLALTLGLSSCGDRKPLARGMGSPKPLNAADYRAPGIPARFGDVDPHAWGTIAPDDYTIHGIDAARYQGRIDFTEARAAGVRFAWLKATEGGDLVDPGFVENAPRARAAGVPVGGYHFYYFCRTAAEQARWFIANVPKVAGDLPPVLDMEWNHTSPTCQRRPDGATVRADIRTYVRLVSEHYGTAPVVYVAPDFYEDNDLGQLSEIEFWLRAVAAHPAERYPGERWSFWQYTGTGVVPGLGGQNDLNAFAGDETAWQAWLAARTQK